MVYRYWSICDGDRGFGRWGGPSGTHGMAVVLDVASCERGGLTVL